MIIDPRVDRCIIWFINKPKVQIINGSPKECIDRIIRYATKIEADEETGEEKRIQIYPIRLDTTGGYAGKVYADHLRENKIEFEVVKFVTDLI